MIIVKIIFCIMICAPLAYIGLYLYRKLIEEAKLK